MIPLRDSAAPRRLTPINSFLIAANLTVFVYEIVLGGRVRDFLFRYAMVPANVDAWLATLDRGALLHRTGALWPPLTLVTSMFVHGGILHVLGNMLYLWIFGAAIEHGMGARRYAVFYMTAGIAAGLATVAIAPTSPVPVVGASGAIAGVLGAYFVMYPRGRILTLLPLFIFFYTAEIPAVAYLLVWFVFQLCSGLTATAPEALAGGVAWWAHIGGFLFGVAVGPLMSRAESRSRQTR